MKNLITFSVEKAITVFMVVIAVAVFGVVSFTRLTTDLFPSINVPFAIVVTPYPGATPQEVEQSVSIPLENAFQTTTNVQAVTSTSNENFSIVTLEFNQNTDMDSAVIEMRENINTILDGFPDAVGFPNIIRINPDLLPIMTFSVTFQDKDLAELTTWVEEDMRPRIERVPGVATFDVNGGFASDLRITLDQAALDTVNQAIKDAFEPFGDVPDILLDQDTVTQLIQAQNLGFPAGFVRLDGLDYLVRVGDPVGSLEALEQLVLFDVDVPFAQLPKVTLEDIATVEFVDANDRQYARVNGVDAISVTIQKSSAFAITEVTNAVNEVLEELQDENAELSVVVLLDQGEFIDQATGGVLNNLILGGILAVLVLLFFLRNIRVTFVVGIAIPVSLLFAIILIYLSGITLNIVSLGGLALGIGMLVDNSIVVIENIFRMKKEGASTKDAAIKGTTQVAGAITASTLTTIGVFAPIIFIEDFVREIFFQLALTIAFSLIASLVIALTFVPAVANRVIRVNKEKRTPFFDALKRVYRTVLKGFFKLKLVVIAGVLILFVVSLLAAISNGFEFFPPTDDGALNATITVPEDEIFVFETFTNDLEDIYERLAVLPDIDSIGITLGGGGFNLFGGGGGTTANVNIVLSDNRRLSTIQMRDEVARILSDEFGHLESSVFGNDGDAGFLVGSGVEILLQGPDLEVLREEALAITQGLEGIEGLRDVNPGFGRSTNDIKITVDKEVAIQQGLTVAQVLGIVANRLESPQRVTSILIDGASYDVFVFNEGQAPRETIASLDELRQLPVGMNPINEQPVLLSMVAEVSIVPGFASIQRLNGTRSLTITADVETGFNASLLAEDVQAMMDELTLPAGYQMTLQGESEEIAAAVNNLLLVGLLGIAIVYMIMASQFQSLIYPFIIMITIPLAFTGGLGVLYLANMPVSIVAILGLIILAGVVVNNGIVLVDYINQLRGEGYELREAIELAGETRLRPIFMTALTTILALTGLAFGFGEGAELTQPLALTAIGGLVYATFLTIFVVPIMYDLVTRRGRLIFGGFLAIVATVGALALNDLFGLLEAALFGGGMLLLSVVIIVWPFNRKKTTPTVIEETPNHQATPQPKKTPRQPDFEAILKRVEDHDDR